MSRPWHIYVVPCDLFFIFIFIFIIIKYVISLKLKQTNLFFVLILEYALLFLDDSEDEESK